ncbi:hypothetical protein ABKN59_009944 [Abortiporus biennis]
MHAESSSSAAIRSHSRSKRRKTKHGRNMVGGKGWSTVCACGVLLAEVVGVGAKFTSALPQSFFFDWVPAGQTPPVPTTAQCDTIQIKWSRGNAQGPNPTAPYFLQVYTSTFIVPLIIPAGDQLEFDWPVPFIPGTLYQICMFDSKGATGGCQDIYTVYQAPNTTLDNPPVCRNLTYPQPSSVLGVDAQVDTGPISQFGWIDQCSDISIKPLNGTPPYTLTIAPTLRPPFNITTNDMNAVNWTVALQYGVPFFVSMVDSTGMSWANGPLHASNGGTIECLSETGDSTSKKKVSPGVAIGSGIGGLAVGLIVGLLISFFFSIWRRRNNVKYSRPDVLRNTSSNNSRDRLMREGYQIEPFTLPSDHEFGVRPSQRGASAAEDSSTAHTTALVDSNLRPLPDHSRTTSSRSTPSLIPTIPPPPSSGQTGTGSSRSPPISESSEPPVVSPSTSRGPSHVYVVHHDGGRAPVTVYTEEGTEVVELPPRYPDRVADPPGTSPPARGRPPAFRQTRRPSLVPNKPSGLTLATPSEDS